MNIKEIISEKFHNIDIEIVVKELQDKGYFSFPKALSNDFDPKNNFSLLAGVNDFLNSFSASASRLGRVKKFESATGLEVSFSHYFVLLSDVLSGKTVVISSRSCKPLIVINLKRVG